MNDNHRHREVLDHIQQRDYRDVDLYDKRGNRMNTLMLVVILLLSGYTLIHVAVWAWGQ